jgi:hypothetical protein
MRAPGGLLSLRRFGFASRNTRFKAGKTKSGWILEKARLETGFPAQDKATSYLIIGVYPL